jgi:hypothetical protein
MVWAYKMVLGLRLHANGDNGLAYYGRTCSLTYVKSAQVTYAFGPQGLHGMTVPVASPSSPPATVAIALDPGEYFTKISGTTLTNPGSPVPARVASLTFTTNKQVYGPYGFPATDKPFEVQGPIYAFHGAVAREDISPTLAAIGFWKVSVAN